VREVVGEVPAGQYGLDEDFAVGGLGRHADALDARLLCLPSDPLADAVPLDQETLVWLKQSRQSPYGGRYPSWGSRERATSGALVLYEQYREDAGWTRYLALHRHGGVEVGILRTLQRPVPAKRGSRAPASRCSPMTPTTLLGAPSPPSLSPSGNRGSPHLHRRDRLRAAGSEPNRARAGGT
jgi:hypothetical protein